MFHGMNPKIQRCPETGGLAPGGGTPRRGVGVPRCWAERPVVNVNDRALRAARPVINVNDGTLWAGRPVVNVVTVTAVRLACGVRS